MAKVLYITFDGITGSLGRSQVLSYLLGLEEKGHSITILSCEKLEKLNSQKEIVESLIANRNVEWHYLSYSNKPPVLGPFLLAEKVKRKATELHKEKQFEIAHCRSYMASLVGIYLKKKFGIKYIFDMRGFWPDERVDGKVWNRKNPLYNFIYKYFKRKETQFLQQADHIVSLTFNGKEELHSWKHVNGKDLSISVVPCCVDLGRFSKQKVNQTKVENFRKQLGINEGDFVLTYLGSVGTWYLLDEMLDFFKTLLEHKPNAKFLFISKGEDYKVKTVAKQKSIPLDRIIVNGVDFDNVPNLLSLSDAAIFFIMPVFSKKASSPIKQGELMAMEIPIICNTGVGDTDLIINDSNAGVLVENFETETYQNAIEKLKNFIIQKNSKSREGAKKYYSLEKGVEIYHNIYQQVLQ